MKNSGDDDIDIYEHENVIAEHGRYWTNIILSTIIARAGGDQGERCIQLLRVGIELLSGILRENETAGFKNSGRGGVGIYKDEVVIAENENI